MFRRSGTSGALWDFPEPPLELGRFLSHTTSTFMKRPLCQTALAFAGALFLALMAGCGDGKVKVKGKLLKGGQPYTVAKETMVTITFTPTAEKAETTYPQSSFKQETGEFEADMPPGKYNVRIVINEKGNKLVPVSPEVAKVVHEVSGGKEINIDIAGK